MLSGIQNSFAIESRLPVRTNSASGNYAPPQNKKAPGPASSTQAQASLNLSRVAFDKSSAIANSKTTLTVSVKNVGNATAGPFYAVISLKNRKVGQLDWPSLRRGTTETRKMRIQLPRNSGNTCYSVKIESRKLGMAIRKKNESACINVTNKAPMPAFNSRTSGVGTKKTSPTNQRSKFGSNKSVGRPPALRTPGFLSKGQPTRLRIIGYKVEMPGKLSVKLEFQRLGSIGRPQILTSVKSPYRGSGVVKTISGGSRKSIANLAVTVQCPQQLKAKPDLTIAYAYRLNTIKPGQGGITTQVSDKVSHTIPLHKICGTNLTTLKPVTTDIVMADPDTTLPTGNASAYLKILSQEFPGVGKIKTLLEYRKLAPTDRGSVRAQVQAPHTGGGSEPLNSDSLKGRIYVVANAQCPSLGAQLNNQSVTIQYEIQLRSRRYKKGLKLTPWFGKVQHALPYRDVCGRKAIPNDLAVASDNAGQEPAAPTYDNAGQKLAAPTSTYALTVTGNKFQGEGEMTVSLRYNKNTRNTAIKIEALPGQPFGGETTAAVISSKKAPKHIAGTTELRVKVNCNGKTDDAQDVLVKYQLRPLLYSILGNTRYGESRVTAQQQIPFSKICYAQSRRPAKTVTTDIVMADPDTTLPTGNASAYLKILSQEFPGVGKIKTLLEYRKLAPTDRGSVRAQVQAPHTGGGSEPLNSDSLKGRIYVVANAQCPSLGAQLNNQSVTIQYEIQLRSRRYKKGLKLTPWFGKVQHALPYRDVCGRKAIPNDLAVASDNAGQEPAAPTYDNAGQKLAAPTSTYALTVTGNKFQGEGEMTVSLRYNKNTRNTAIKIEALPGQPFGGETTAAVISSKKAPKHIAGTTELRVKVNCNGKTDDAQDVLVKYQLRPLLYSILGNTRYGESRVTAQQQIPFSKICYAQ